MGQDDIVEWLRQKRLAGDSSFFSVQEIRQGVCASGFSSGARVYEQCLQLYRFGILDMRRNGLLIGGYRLRRKYAGKGGEE